MCFSFAGLIQRSGVTGHHRDGWGVTFYEGKGTRTFRDTEPGVQSEVARLVENYPIRSCLAISHIRKANRGRPCLENTHPFQRELWGENWTFAHNGQLKGIKNEPLGYDRPVGTTDSEHAFCWLLARLRSRFQHRPRRAGFLWSCLEEGLGELSEKGVLNVLMGDGRFLYAWCTRQLCWITRRAPFGEARLVDKDMTVDFQSVTTDKDIVTVVATRPLTSNEEWAVMRKNTLYVFERGEWRRPPGGDGTVRR